MFFFGTESPTPEQIRAELDRIERETNDGSGEVLPSELTRELYAALAVASGAKIEYEDAPAAAKVKIICDFAKVQAEQLAAEGETARAELMQKAFESATELYKRLSEYLAEGFENAMKRAEQLAEVLKERAEYVAKLQPFLEKELAKMHTEHPETEGITLVDVEGLLDVATISAEDAEEFERDFSDDENPVIRYIRLVITAISAARERLDSETEQTADAAKKRHTMNIKPEYLIYPTDKVNYQAFEGVLMGFNPITKKPHEVPMTAKKSKKGVSVYVSISFEDAKISAPLDVNDYDILNLVYSYLIAGNNAISLCRMLETFGEPRPTTKQLEEAYTRLAKLRMADITIDCEEWAKMKGKKAYSIYKRSILDGIAFEEIRKEKNGELLDVILHCTVAVEDLPLYRFAETSGQLTQIPMHSAMITGNNSITGKTAAIRHMLLDRIIKHHNSGKSGKIAKLDTIYEKIGAESKTEKNRARKQIENFMLEWVKNGLIYGFAFRKKGKSFDAVVFARDKAEMDEAKTENCNLCEWYHR